MKLNPLLLITALITIAVLPTIFPNTTLPFITHRLLAADLPSITATELDRQLKQNAPQILLIDVRTDEEYNIGHLPGAIHIPLKTIESGDGIDRIKSQLNRPPADKQLILYCHSGRRSAIAIYALQKSGIPATQLTGGIIEWKKQVDPTILIP